MDFISEKIYEIAQEAGALVKESARSVIIKCPECGKDKVYFEKNEHFYKCFSGSCTNSGNYIKLYAQLREIDYSTAKDEFYSGKRHHKESIVKIDLKLDQEIPEDESSIELPPHFYPIGHQESLDGLNYMIGRGVPLKILEVYGVMYSPILRRVVFVQRDEFGNPVGYQARAIDQVESAARMRNNPGYKKGRHFMFWDQAIHEPDHIIVAEGPVDALKFSLIGGNVASLGKELSNRQLMMLNDSPAKKIYWALDADANNLLPEYAAAVGKDNYLITVPEEAEARILALGKNKADFGECTFKECEKAFLNAKKINSHLELKLF